MVAKELVVGLVIGFGVGAVAYGLGVQKEEPRTSTAIFSIIGATAGLLAITSALTRDDTAGQTAGAITGSIGSIGNAFR